MVHELQPSHRIELKMSRELLHQLKSLKESPGWKHLVQHISRSNAKRRDELANPAYSMEALQKQNFEKGILLGSEMFTAGIDLEIDRLTNGIAALEKKLGDDDELDTE